MEVVLFNRTGKNVKSTKGRSLKDLTAIATPEQLLAKNKRENLVKKIQASSSLSDSRFETLCLSLIHNLINHCQSLPETMNSYYSQQGGVLDYALNRTEAAVHLFREFVIAEGDLSEEQKLWLYALLTAGLLQGIGKLQIDYLVNLHDLNGQNLKIWNPLLESMSATSSYYHYEILSAEDDDLRRRLNLLLARLLMPASGFSWIASNPDVLRVWLALLHEDWQSAGTLGALLVRADAIAIQRYMTEHMLAGQAGRSARAGRISTFIDTNPQDAANREQLIGVEFINWLMQSLEKGIVMINKAPLFMVPGGMLMCSDLFKLFVREHPEFKNWQAIQSGFLSLGLHSVGAEGAIVSRFEQANTQQMVSGIVFENYAVALPEQIKFHNLNTGKISTLSAVELVNKSQSNVQFNQKTTASHAQGLQKLDARGQWVQPGEAGNNLTFGRKF